MFDLEKAISGWREEAAQHVPASDLEELESHLRDCVDARLESGARREDAFLLAVHQLGDLKTIGRELVRESGKLSPIPRRRPTRSTSVRTLVWVLAAVLILFAVECFRLYNTAIYKSKVTFALNPIRLNPVIPIFESNGGAESEPAIDLETEMQILLSDETLYAVVDRLGLDEEWEMTRSSALRRLKERTRVRRLGDSRMLQLLAADSEAQRAAELAAEVVNSYGDRRKQLFVKTHRNALDTLQMRLKFQSDRVEEARLRMLDLSERYRITPGEWPLREQVEQKFTLARSDAEIALAEAMATDADPGVVRGLQKRMELMQGSLQNARDLLFDARRRMAEYSSAEREHSRQWEMLGEMEEALARSEVFLSMPIVPLTVHGKAEVSVRKESVSWIGVWIHVFAKGWIFIVGMGTLGWWLSRRQSHPAKPQILASPFPVKGVRGGKKGADEEISWA